MDGFCRVYDNNNGKLVREFDVTTSANCMRFMPSGKNIAIGGGNGTAMIADVLYGTVMKYNAIHHRCITCISVHPEADLLLSGSDDCSVIVSKLSTLQTIFTLSIHKASVSSVDWSSSGKFFVSSGSDNRIMYWQSPEILQDIEENHDSSHTNQEEEEELPIKQNPISSQKKTSPISSHNTQTPSSNLSRTSYSEKSKSATPSSVQIPNVQVYEPKQNISSHESSQSSLAEVAQLINQLTKQFSELKAHIEENDSKIKMLEDIHNNQQLKTPKRKKI